MSLARAALRSTKTRILVAAVGCLIGWQLWLGLAAPGKIAPGIPADSRRVDLLVTLPFPPERFHIQKFQELGRVSGTTSHSVEVRGVNRADIAALARPYWVRRVEPLPTGG